MKILKPHYHDARQQIGCNEYNEIEREFIVKSGGCLLMIFVMAAVVILTILNW